MGLSSYVVMTAAVAHVEAARLVKAAAQELVPVFRIVTEDNVVMTDADINPVVNAPQPKPVKMDNASGLLLLIVQERFVEPTELEEVAELALQVKDAVLVNVSATTIAMKETVVMRFNQMEPIQPLVLLVPVVLVLMDSLVDQTVDALL